jgi:hypothetical protein
MSGPRYDFAVAGVVVMNIEIHRADPRVRRLTLIMLSAGLLAAILLMTWFHHWLDRSTVAMPGELLVLEMRRMMGITGMASGLCVLVLAGYVARLARRVIEERRWPLRASRVVRDTRVRSGEAAVTFARMLNITAVVLIALALGVGVLGWRLFGAV